MSVADELNRIISAKESIRQAIIDKGVEVDSSLHIEDFPAKIALIEGGQPAPQPAQGDAKITGYDTATGLITGTGFGNTMGAVYMHDWETAEDVIVPVESWSDTQIVLSEPIDTESFYTVTSIYAMLPDERVSTKFLVRGKTLEGYGRVHYIERDGSLAWVEATVETDIIPSGTSAKICNISAARVIGVQIGEATKSYVPKRTSYLLSGFYRLVQPVDLEDVQSLSNTYMYGVLNSAYSFNQPIHITGTKIPPSFLYYNYTFNQPILGMENVTSIGGSFLNACYNFNQELDFSNVKTIGDSCLYNTRTFNQALNLENCTSIGTGFLYGAYAFNKPLSIPLITSTGENFLYQCGAFNSYLDLPNVTIAANGFLTNCYSVSGSNINIPSVIAAGTNFLAYCTSLGTIPRGVENLTRFAGSFMAYSTGASGELHLENLQQAPTLSSFLYNNQIIDLYVGSSPAPTSVDNQSLAWMSTASSPNTRRDFGVTIHGANAQAWADVISDTTTRKIYVAED